MKRKEPFEVHYNERNSGMFEESNKKNGKEKSENKNLGRKRLYVTALIDTEDSLETQATSVATAACKQIFGETEFHLSVIRDYSEDYPHHGHITLGDLAFKAWEVEHPEEKFYVITIWR